MQLQSLKAAVQGMLAQADQLRSPSDRQTLYLHNSQVLALLLEAPGETYPGWPKAALALLRPVVERQSGPLPSLTPSPGLLTPQHSRPLVETISAGPLLNRLQEQLLTVLELPD